MAAVLLVTSDVVHGSSWRDGLEARRHEVLTAASAGDAVERLREGGIDLVVLDFELAGGVRNLIYGLERLPDPPPFILVSEQLEAPVLSARLGAAGFVPKPCAVDELVEIVARVSGVPAGG